MARQATMMAMADKIRANENFMKIVAMERLFEITLRLGMQKEALEIVKIFEDLHFDQGKHDIQDLREALENLDLDHHPELAKMQKSFMKMYLDFLIPARPR